MLERERHERARAERNEAREGVAGAYSELARSEARRVEDLAGAVEAAGEWRAAVDALDRAERLLGVRVRRLLDAGMTAADVASAVGVDQATVRRLVRLARLGGDVASE